MPPAIVSACCQSLVELCVLRENEDLAGLAGAVRKNDGAADLLISVTGVNAELDMNFDSLVELCLRGLDDQIHGVGDFVLHAAVDQLRAVDVLFTFKQCNILLSGDAE